MKTNEMDSRKRIMVSAYACEPGLGSEIGVGWHWVLEMSRYYDLWVLTRRSNRATIEAWMAENAAAEDADRDTLGHGHVSDIHFVYFDLPDWARRWKKGLRGVRIYYNMWQKLSGNLVMRTMRGNNIETFHHVTYGNVMWPVSKAAKHCKTFIWGPVGGLETIPREYTRHYDRSQRLRESLRRLLAWKTRHSHGFSTRCRRADLIICKTDHTLQSVPARYRHKSVLMTDVATDNIAAANAADPAAKRDDITRFITVGRLEGWRGFDLAIEALSRMTDTAATLTVVGSGPDKQRLKSLARTLGVENRVVFTGKVDHQQYRALMQQADAVVSPSLKEGAVTVGFDSLAMGKPLIAIDTAGYTRAFTPEYSRIIPLGKRQSTITALAAAMDELTDASLRSRMGEKARSVAPDFAWRRHGEKIRQLFDSKI